MNRKLMGPYSREALEQLIARGAISGEEEIAVHPDGHWVPIATLPEFYDLILAAMESEGKKLNSPESAIAKMEANTILAVDDQKMKRPKARPEKELEATRIADLTHVTEFTKAIFSGVSKISETIKKSIGLEATKAVPPSVVLKKTFDHSKFVPIDTKIPTMTMNDDKIRPTGEDSERRPWLGLLAVALGLLGGGYFIFQEMFAEKTVLREGKLHLLAPTGESAVLSAEESKTYMMRIKRAFERSNSSDWIEAQNLLVKVAEAEPTNTDVREKLCMTYKELWPYAYQDAEDLQVLNFMVQSTRALNVSVSHSRTCEFMRSWLTGKFQEAKGQLETLLQEFPNNVFYIWLKAELLLSENDFINGQGFASSLLTIWPEFSRGKILSVHLNIGLGKFQEARELLGQILEQYPDHREAKLILGDIEFRNFQQDDRAWDLLVSAMKSEEFVPKETLVSAYSVLALLSEKKGDFSAAREFAEKGYALNPTNENLRDLVYRLGGNDKKVSEISRTQEIVALGDQYARTGDCLAAQAQYRAAFDLNPKYPQAAVKAARCLNSINQIFQSFEYLKRAIQSNPQYFPAYTLLADYYSQKFDFASASGILNQARAYSSEAYEIYKGYALVELRKNNFTGAIGYINRAIGIYSTDPECYVILSKAQLGIGNAKEALQTAQKAIEIDSVNIDAHVAYGQAVGVVQGESTGLDYFRKLVAENKYILEYKLAYANALLALERYNEALPVFQEVLSLDPKHKKAQLGLGDCLSGLGKIEESLAAFLLAATFDPTDPEPIVKAGLLYLDTSRLDIAVQQFERALMINKNYPKAYFYIGKAAFLMGDLKKALEAAMAERRANPNLVDSYLLAAEVYWIKEKYPECTAEYQQAIKLRPQGGELYVKLARCHRKSGSLDVAQSMLDIAAEKESGYADIYKEQGALFQAQGDKAAAVKAYEKYLALSPNAVDKNVIESLMRDLSLR